MGKVEKDLLSSALSSNILRSNLFARLNLLHLVLRCLPACLMMEEKSGNRERCHHDLADREKSSRGSENSPLYSRNGINNSGNNTIENKKDGTISQTTRNNNTTTTQKSLGIFFVFFSADKKFSSVASADRNGREQRRRVLM